MNAPVEVWTSLDPEWDRDAVLKHMYDLTKWLYECAEQCNVHFLHIGGNFGSTKECFVGFEGTTSDGVTYYAYLCWDGILAGKTVYFEVVPAPGFTPLQMFLKVKGMVKIKSYPRAIMIMRQELARQVYSIAVNVRNGGDLSDATILASFPADLIVYGFRRVILYSVFRDAEDGIKRVGLELDDEDDDLYHAFVLSMVRSMSVDTYLGECAGHLPRKFTMPQTIYAGVELLFWMWSHYLESVLEDDFQERGSVLYAGIAQRLLRELKKTGPYECSLINDYYHPYWMWTDTEKKLFENF